MGILIERKSIGIVKDGIRDNPYTANSTSPNSRLDAFRVLSPSFDYGNNYSRNY
jgi:hypothetical protein